MFENNTNDKEKQYLVVKLNEALEKISEKEKENSNLLKEIELLKKNLKENNFPQKNNIIDQNYNEQSLKFQKENNKLIELIEQLNQFQIEYNNVLIENNKLKMENKKLKEKFIHEQNINNEKRDDFFKNNIYNMESSLNNNEYLDQIFSLQVLLSKKNEEIRILKEKIGRLNKNIPNFELKCGRSDKSINNRNISKKVTDTNKTVLALVNPSLLKLGTMINNAEQKKNSIKPIILNTEENRNEEFIFESENELREKINQLISVKNNFFQNFTNKKKVIIITMS